MSIDNEFIYGRNAVIEALKVIRPLTRLCLLMSMVVHRSYQGPGKRKELYSASQQRKN